MLITDRAAQREAAFQHWLEKHGEPYAAKVVENGNVPWHDGDVESRRDLWMRRYERPAPPTFLPPTLSLREINSAANAASGADGSGRATAPSNPTELRTAA